MNRLRFPATISHRLARKRLMEIYDIIMLIVLGGAMVFGAIKGFAWQLASIASITVSYVVAYKFREPFSQSIQADPPWNKFLAMLILYIGTALVVWVAFRMVSTTIDRLRLREFDRQIGALFGLAKGALYCILITLFAVTLMGERIRGTIVQSTSGRYIAKVLDRSQAVIPPEIHEVVQPYLERFDDRFNSDGWEQSEPTFNRMPWLAGQQEQAPSANTTGQNWQTSFGVAQNQNAPADRRQWPAQQAQQQQTWNNFQR